MINLILVEFNVLISSQISSDQAIRYMDIIAYALIMISNRPKIKGVPVSQGTRYIENNLFYRLVLRQKLLSMNVTTVVVVILLVSRELLIAQTTVLILLMAQHYFNI